MTRKEKTMEHKVYLAKWNYEGDKIRLVYQDGTSLFVTKKDFDRAFGCIISLTKAEAEEDFAIKE